MVCDVAQDIGQPGARIDAVELGGDDQRVDSSGALAAAVGAAEQPSLTAEGNRVVILPISSRLSKCIIDGTPSMGGASVASMGSAALMAMSFMWKSFPARSSR